MLTFLALALAVATLLLWYSSMSAREAAMAAGRHACARSDVQLLDETVALSGMGLSLGRNGRLRLRRHYRFEFSLDGSDRHPGELQLLGDRVISIQLKLPDGSLILPQDRG